MKAQNRTVGCEVQRASKQRHYGAPKQLLLFIVCDYALCFVKTFKTYAPNIKLQRNKGISRALRVLSSVRIGSKLIYTTSFNVWGHFLKEKQNLL